MAKTIYSQIDELTLTLQLFDNVGSYCADGELGLIDGLSKDDIVEGFPISLEVTFSGKTIVKNLICVSVYQGFPTFADAPEPSSANVSTTLYFPVSGQAFVTTVNILKDYAESVFGQPSSKVIDGETTYCYEPVKIVISSVEENSGSNSNNNMKVLKITEDYKMSKILRKPDGYYIVKENPILLHKKGSENIKQIPAESIISIRSVDSPFYPMRTITNCDDNVTYYITSIFQNKDVIEFEHKDGEKI